MSRRLRLLCLVSLWWAPALFLGCSVPQGATTVSLNRELMGGDPFWRVEIDKHLPPGSPPPVLFSCHGGYRKGVWCAVPDEGDPIPMRVVAASLKGMFPDRPIFLLSCNEKGHALGVPGVHYAKKLVATYPYVGWWMADRFGEFVVDE
jgi:hypothetical protein